MAGVLKEGGSADAEPKVEIVDGVRVRQDELKEWREKHPAAKKAVAKKAVRRPANKSRSADVEDK